LVQGIAASLRLLLTFRIRPVKEIETLNYQYMKLLNRITNLRNPLKPLLVLCGVTCRFILRSGDKVWVNIIYNEGKKDIRIAEIEGFRSYGICYKDHVVKWHHYCEGLFYGFGYHGDGYAIVTKKKWHLYPAILIEKIRLKLPTNIALWLHLENGR